jgi:5-dehydro-2-deoxygluconokinase
MHFPFFILPFDHRSGFAKELLGVTYPLDEASTEKAKALKKIIWEGFLLADEQTTTDGTLGILVDEELGGEIIHDAKSHGVVHIVSVEKSGAKEFTFIHGDDFEKELKRIQPTFSKALVNYVFGDEEVNAKTREKLKRLSDFSIESDIPCLIEVLTGGADAETVAKIIIELEEAGIKPAIWKLEGFADSAAWETIERVTDIPIVVLGHGKDKEEVDAWVKAASESGKVEGIAIGRTVFLEPLKQFTEGKIDQAAAAQEISANFLHFIELWDNSGRGA